MIFEAIEQTEATREQGRISKQRREAAGWSIERTAKALNVTVEEIEACEDGRGELVEPTESVLRTAEKYGMIQRY